MPDSFVSVSADGAIGWITLNRPPANSYDSVFVHQLGVAVDRVKHDDMIRVVIVRSALEKFFSAGADVKAFAENSHDANMRMIIAEHAALEQIENTAKIFIAMIAGHCLGGGLEIALACDLRFASDGNYKIGLPEVTLGLLPGNGGTQRLPRLIGKNKALDLMITGRTVSPSDALVLGIVDRVIPTDQLEAQTKAYAESLASGATFAVGSIKRAVNQGLELPLPEGLMKEREITAKLFESEDAREGIAAFAEKRKPEYKGK